MLGSLTYMLDNSKVGYGRDSRTPLTCLSYEPSRNLGSPRHTLVALTFTPQGAEFVFLHCSAEGVGEGADITLVLQLWFPCLLFSFLAFTLFLVFVAIALCSHG